MGIYIYLEIDNVVWCPVSTISKASESKDGFNRCEHIVKQWASSSLDLEVKDDKHVLQNLLFFLHVPRTGGRTYFHWYKWLPSINSLPFDRDEEQNCFDETLHIMICILANDLLIVFVQLS